ncbi:C4-methyl sterol oxidase [Fomitiporia mediterranea MF3/22]|uniref:C4-methyl sterol oxidase n=1 Tax=Fomitiporia mediterranea (strain MF3/22) TaxID=694068 RepID=UPI0004408A7F|nr:C4-methyl sterol oxidase [Fomitiporia mediterranea MF3/22]EJD06589.1 C4-methyl sterol oxidase [Fomitiporia mediterranea MF3/22]
MSNVTAPVYYASEFLYANVDFTSLSWLELKWAQWYLLFNDPAIATGVMSFLLHEIVYFGRCIPWIIVDSIPYFRRWKLQPNKLPTALDEWECTKLVLFSHFTIELPQIWLFHPLAEYFGLSTWQVPFPSWRTMFGQVALFFIFEDFFHYCAHQCMHYGPLYKHIHKIHHKYSAPFGLAAEYAHPIEVLVLGMGTLCGPLLYCYFTQSLHIVTVYAWVTLRLFQAIDAHSGYDFPWSLQHIFPFWAGAEHHDYHHMAFMDNFASSFRYLDFIFGTDERYRAHKAKLNKMKEAASKSGASREEQEAMEQKLMEESERIGIAAEAKAEAKRVW